MIWMLVGFLIVLFILAKVGWPMIMGAVTKRNQHISDSLMAAKEANDALAGIEAAKEKALVESQAEQIRIMNESQELKKQLIEEAQALAEAEKVMADAHLKIQKEQAEAMAQIKAEVITLSVEIAEKLLQRELNDKDAQSRYIEEILKDNNQRIEA